MADAVSTKQALAKGLKATLEHKSLDRVTVGDITTFCGLNRQTFYYHFEDKYALLNWIYYTELMLPLAEGSAPEDWPRRVARMLDRMREEGAFYRRALRGEGQRGFEALLTAMVRELAAGLLEQADRPGETADKAFLASFFAYGVTGMVTAWVQDWYRKAGAPIGRARFLSDWRSLMTPPAASRRWRPSPPARGCICRWPAGRF